MKKKVLEFYSELIKNENHRFESWEHCYINFKKAFNKTAISDEEKDTLSLHLAFYLASWGMYRGSSFILQKDYKVFYPIIDLLITEKDNFNDIVIESLLLNHNDDLIKSYVFKYFLFDKKLSEILERIRQSVNQKVISDVSYTLKTKIILGTYGSVPAYDRFFQDGLRNSKDPDLIISYSEKGIIEIIRFAKNNFATLNRIKKRIINIQEQNNKLNKVDYPIMKIIDMYFWKIGFDINQNRK